MAGAGITDKTQAGPKMRDELKQQFEQIFVKHYERLANTRQSVGGLPLTLENIVCFILFGGRELDIEDVYGDVSERYNMETFMADAREAGVETEEHLKDAVSGMLAKKFLHLQPDNHFYAYQSTRETARLFNRVYPKMQGMNMLAYIGQTMQEVESGRVDEEAALSRFDQTLQKQGVPLPKPKIPVIKPPPKPAAAPQKTEEPKPASSRIIRDYVVTSSVKPKPEKDEKAKQSAGEDAGLAPPPQEPGPPVREQLRDALEPAPLVDEPAVTTTPVNDEAAGEIEAGKEIIPDDEQGKAETPAAPADDEEIAARIAAFEKELALVCPLCKTSALKEQTTAAGKVFYTCTSSQCNFISWGRPHQIPCPRCKNSFMVEVSDAEGQVFLKCPRATCQHRQPLVAAPAAPATVRKVVRKRLVRRKA